MLLASISDALDGLRARIALGPLYPQEERHGLAQLYRDAATWFEEEEIATLPSTMPTHSSSS
jgi:hypothetical protein